MSRDRITLKGISARGFHGVHAEERERGQVFVVDVELDVPLTVAGGTDDLRETVHYGVLAREVAAEIERDPVDLIETLAQRIAELALRRELVESVRVTVHKPEAPLPLDFEDVAVTIERDRRGMGTEAVIALGANLGDRAATLASAVETLDLLPHLSVTGRSPVLETVAMTQDGPDPSRPGYLNQVITATTTLGPAELLATLLAVEHAFGRVRTGTWADRTLDLDLITHGASILETTAVTVPHPRAHERDFVLEPWLALDPGAVLPGRGAVRDLLDRLRAGAS